MKTYYDCIPCFIRQALDAVRLATADEKIHESILREILLDATELDFSQPPPRMGQAIHRRVRQLSGNSDPYKDVKTKSNQYALALYPRLVNQVEASAHPMETAVRLAIAGNIIDFGVSSAVSKTIIDETIAQTLSEPLFGDMDRLLEQAASAGTILYIGDNAGEIVFDRLLIERFFCGRVIFSVRGGPIINDATLADARETGMNAVAEVIDNGSDAPGTILDDCSEPFLNAFESADLIIAKGQGNYETLSHVAHRPIVFLLKAKCPVISRHIGCEQGASVIRYAG